MNQRATEGQNDQAKETGPGLWVALVPAAVLLVAALVVMIPRDVHDPPPQMRVKAKSPTVTVKPPKSNLKEPLVRVNVTPGGVDSLRLEVRGPCRWKRLDADEQSFESVDLTNVIVTAGQNGLQVGSLSLSANRMEIQPDQSPAVFVNGHLYRGSLRLFRRTDGKVSAVNVVPVEEYLASVVDSEMPAAFPEAARQAQAIVARTYALYQIEKADRASQYDLLSSQRSQKYLGVEYLDNAGRRLAGESDSSRRAVRATHAQVCTRSGKLFCTYYSAVCGGQTTNGNQVFKDVSDAVRSVPCTWCRESPFYRWSKEVSYDEFQNRLGRPLPEGNHKTSIRQIVEPGQGSIVQFEFDNGRERWKMSGLDIRERMQAGVLLSPHFKIRIDADRVIFEGHGHGHGVGFCQWGAKGQAESGRTCEEIVKYYYSGIELKSLNY